MARESRKKSRQTVETSSLAMEGLDLLTRRELAEFIDPFEPIPSPTNSADCNDNDLGYTD
jgi:hypothetical protein